MMRLLGWLSIRTVLTGVPVFAVVPLFATALRAQPVTPASSLPSVSRPADRAMSRADSSCVALPAWDHGVVCGAESRREEYMGGLLVGGGMGALVGVPTGMLFRGECNQGVRSAMGRGALAGMAVSTLALTVLPRVTRTALEQRRADERALAQRSRCGHSPGSGAWRGAAVYGAGAAAVTVFGAVVAAAR